jgi:hypothetical protein
MVQDDYPLEDRSRSMKSGVFMGVQTVVRQVDDMVRDPFTSPLLLLSLSSFYSTASKD